MKVPPIKECEAIIQEYKMPGHIREHTEAVRKIANCLAKKINGVDKEVVDKGALMHDSLKMYCIKNNCRHAEEAGKVLSEKGYPEFGEVLKLHGLEEVNNFNETTSLEAKIVWYADKRANGNKVVTLDERYAYLKERYGSKNPEKMGQIKSTIENSKKVEEELLKLANLGKDYLFGEC
ncbi:HD domain-containing protein [archaeon]|nr:HD domain-containing protein [archaeon]